MDAGGGLWAAGTAPHPTARVWADGPPPPVGLVSEGCLEVLQGCEEPAAGVGGDFGDGRALLSWIIRPVF